MKIKIKRATVVDGDVVMPGEVVVVKDKVGKMIINAGRAEVAGPGRKGRGKRVERAVGDAQR